MKIFLCLLIAAAALNLASNCKAKEPDQAAACPSSFLVRLPRSSIEQPPQRVVQRDPVDCVIVGTRARGTSLTNGTMRVALDEQASEPTLHIQFAGTSTSKTIGTHGPAIMHMHSTTSFTASRTVVLKLDQGLVTYPTRVRLNTTLTVDDVQSNKPGLRGRLVRRIATRKSQQLHQQATREATALAERNLRHGFEQGVQHRLVALDRQFEGLRKMMLAADKKSKLQIALVGENHSSVVFYVAAERTDTRLLPEAIATGEGLQIWLRNPVPLEATSITTFLPEPFAWLTGSSEESLLTKYLSLYGWRCTTRGDWLIARQEPLIPTPDIEAVVVRKPVIDDPETDQSRLARD